MKKLILETTERIKLEKQPTLISSEELSKKGIKILPHGRKYIDRRIVDIIETTMKELEEDKCDKTKESILKDLIEK